MRARPWPGPPPSRSPLLVGQDGRSASLMRTAASARAQARPRPGRPSSLTSPRGSHWSDRRRARARRRPRAREQARVLGPHRLAHHSSWMRSSRSASLTRAPTPARAPPWSAAATRLEHDKGAKGGGQGEAGTRAHLVGHGLDDALDDGLRALCELGRRARAAELQVGRVDAVQVQVLRVVLPEPRVRLRARARTSARRAASFSCAQEQRQGCLRCPRAMCAHSQARP